jgi:predicted acyl esterase
VVKLIDVYTADHPDPDPNPTGTRMGNYQQLVRGGPLRGKFREGFGRPRPLEPGKVTRFTWELDDVCHTFRAGHRIMVHVQSSWFPLMDRNPQTYCDIYRAAPTAFQKAEQRVYRSAAHASAIGIRVIPSEP